MTEAWEEEGQQKAQHLRNVEGGSEVHSSSAQSCGLEKTQGCLLPGAAAVAMHHSCHMQWLWFGCPRSRQAEHGRPSRRSPPPPPAAPLSPALPPVSGQESPASAAGARYSPRPVTEEGKRGHVKQV